MKKKQFNNEPILDFLDQHSQISEDAPERVLTFSERTCILTREQNAKDGLLRFVLSPQNEVTVDLKQSLPGRGAWVTANKTALTEAIRKKSFHRAFKKLVVVEADLPHRVEELLKRSVISSLSMANKAGLVITGFVKLDAAIDRGEIMILLHATEAAPDGAEKLDRKFKRSGKNHIPPKYCLTSPEISLATGSDNVIHAGIKEGGAASAFLRALQRYNDYRTDQDCQEPSVPG